MENPTGRDAAFHSKLRVSKHVLELLLECDICECPYMCMIQSFIQVQTYVYIQVHMCMQTCAFVQVYAYISLQLT